MTQLSRINVVVTIWLEAMSFLRPNRDHYRLHRLNSAYGAEQLSFRNPKSEIQNLQGVVMKTVSSDIIWQGTSWRFRVDELEAPNGQRLAKGVIEHPGAVVLVPVREGQNGPEVLMLRQYRLALAETILELPAGTRGWDEDWLACAQRELREETGFRADSLHCLGEIWPSPGVSSELMRLYLATGLQAAPLPGDVDEEIELQPMPLADLVMMAQDGRLRDAKSIIGILKTAVFLNTP
jgi:ADP-ribose pyrophosphatase